MKNHYLAYVKDEPERIDVVVGSSIEELLGPSGGYDSADGPFTAHEAFSEARTQGDHVDRAVPNCPECEEMEG